MGDYISLGDVVTLKRGTTYRGLLLGESGPVLLGLGSIARNGGFRASNLQKYGGESDPSIILKAGDLYVSLKDVTQSADLLGAVARIPLHIPLGRLTQDTVGITITDRRFSPEYTYWMLRTPQYRAYCRKHATGTTNLGLPRDAFLAFEIPVPDRARMELVNLLSALDEKIAANSAMANSTDQYLEAVMARELSSGDIDIVPLGTIADVNATVVAPSCDNLRYVDIAAVGVGHYDFPAPTNWSDAPSRAKRQIRRGDTLWSTVRPNRRSHALNLSHDPTLVGSTGLAVISPRSTGFAYLYEITKLPEFTIYLESAAEGSAYPAVRADRFSNAPVPLLPAGRQEQFESVAAPLRMHAHQVTAESRQLAALRDTLVPQLMSGKLRVRDAEKQVEEVV